ncbi:acyl-CoA dehydrogenase [Streptomyces spiramenti]|uniref:Acyl-CoA oxidase n=1 Tax=Streptomyces spiramenti TaxID=2720606 RepID=A0ABX1AVI2_9ACTN|nr:acyl-CoA dehydrogenase [Streptomyces spiramenti]NJP69030.1 acyl-CoA oxidase [Streptomyces spiramenti]
MLTDGPGRALDRSLADAVLRDGAAPSLHPAWRDAVSGVPFADLPEPGAPHGQAAYDRLRELHRRLPLPAELLAGRPRALAALHEWTGQRDGALATVAGIHYNLFLGSLLDDGVSAPRDLSDYTSLRRIGTFLCTEVGHGNDAPALETLAHHDPVDGTFVLHTPHPNAGKYMPNTGPAGGAKSGVVAARLMTGGSDQGVFLFLAPLTGPDGRALPGVRVDPLPVRAGTPVDHSLTSFDRVTLPASALVQGPHGRILSDGRFASEVGGVRRRFLHSIDRVTTGKLCMSACAVGVARSAVAIAARYGALRTVSGPAAGSRVPLTAYRPHRERLLTATTTAYAMTFLHREVTDRWTGRHPDQEAAARLVAVAKGWLTWRGREVVVESRERCGARGMFPVNDLAAYLADIEGAITAEGDNLAVWSRAGAEMILGHDADAGAVPPRATGDEDPTDPVFLRHALRAAERHWQIVARRDLRSAAGGAAAREGSAEVFRRWNAASAAALELVEAYVVGVAADAFRAAADGADDPGARSLLDRMCALFALRQVEARSGLLITLGALTTRQAAALPALRGDLVDRLAPSLATLVGAFGLPEAHLASLPLLAAPTVPRPLPQQHTR